MKMNVFVSASSASFDICILRIFSNDEVEQLKSSLKLNGAEMLFMAISYSWERLLW